MHWTRLLVQNQAPRYTTREEAADPNAQHLFLIFHALTGRR
jgi:hypothetical protein